MAKLTYIGPHDAVEVDLPSGEVVEAERNKPVEIPDDLAKRLLAQDTWVSAGKAKKEDD